MPGETAPSHRHSPAALRLVVEGEGAYTAVDGERTFMHRGDFVITPSWTWHSHGKEGDGPVIWLDGLDVPLVGFLNAVFFQDYEEAEFPVSRPEGDSIARYGSGILPVDYAPHGKTTPILNYTYERTRAAFDAMARGRRWRSLPRRQDPLRQSRHRRLRDADDGRLRATTAARLPWRPYRSTDSTVYAVIDGSGRTTIDGETFDWQPHDVFVVPGWRWHYHQATEETALFSFSDRPVQQKLGLWRDRRG